METKLSVPLNILSSIFQGISISAIFIICLFNVADSKRKEFGPIGQQISRLFPLRVYLILGGFCPGKQIGCHKVVSFYNNGKKKHGSSSIHLTEKHHILVNLEIVRILLAFIER